MVQREVIREIIRFFFHVRLNQFKRTLSELGFWRSALALLLILFLLAGLTRLNNGYLLCGLCLSVVFPVHASRKDKRFLSALFPYSFTYILLAEYLLLSLFFLILLAFRQPLLIAPCLLALVLVPFLNISISAYIRDRVHLIGGRYYELSSGFRQGMLLLLPVYLFGLSFSYLFYVSLVSMLLFTLVFQSFYLYGEPATFLRLYADDKKSFLNTKLRCHIPMFALLSLPFLCSFLVFHAGYWYVALILLLLCVCLIAFTITAKYAFYQPNSYLRHLQLFNLLAFVSLFIPFLLPLVFIMLYRFYKKSIQNLDNYFLC